VVLVDPQVKIMKLSQKSVSNIHHILVYGGTKSGKTLLVGRLAEKYKLLWFDLENGVDVNLQLPPELQDNIEVISLKDTRSYPIAIETLLKVIKGAKQDICELHGKVACAICKKESNLFNTVELNTLTEDTIVVFDSLTQLTNSAIAHITKAQPEDYKLDYDDWGNLGKLLDTFLSHIQNAPFNVVCISHETETEMEDGKLKLVPTAGTRNFSRNVGRYFGEIVYCEVKNKKHFFASSTTYANNILTGSRTGTSIEFSKEASLLSIFDKSRRSENEVVENTPAKNAMTALEKLKEKMKG
jgi:hypothetical protein